MTILKAPSRASHFYCTVKHLMIVEREIASLDDLWHVGTIRSAVHEHALFGKPKS